jgi:hypothetical protein
MRLSPSAIAAKSASRWEIDLSPGRLKRPRKAGALVSLKVEPGEDESYHDLRKSRRSCGLTLSSSACYGGAGSSLSIVPARETILER